MNQAVSMSPGGAGISFRRSAAFGLIGFLTLVDLFAVQAILPVLATRYDAGPAEIGLAANAGTLGMAIAGLLAGVIGDRVERRGGIWLSLAALSIPTILLAHVTTLEQFAALRVVQGLCMAAAFTLTLTYFGERCTKTEAAGALAAYVTGNVASNLVGRLVASYATSFGGVEFNFYLFAVLNLAGAFVAWRVLSRTVPEPRGFGPRGHFLRRWTVHLADPLLLRAFVIGFLILFGFLGAFSYLGFTLMRDFGLGMGQLGLVYFVFVPAMLTTPLAGRVVGRFGAPRPMALALALSAAGMALAAVPSFPVLLLGLALMAAAAFFAQALATGFVARSAIGDRAGASGLYLASYYFGGLAGAAVVGQVFEAFGWTGAAAAAGAAFVLATALALTLRERDQ